MAYVRQLNPGCRMHAVIGGMHLVSAGSHRLTQTIDTLKTLGRQRVIPCHCSGTAAVAVMRDRLGSRLESAAAGMTFTF